MNYSELSPSEILDTDVSDYGSACGPIRTALQSFADGYIEAMFWANGSTYQEMGPDDWHHVGDVDDYGFVDLPESVQRDLWESMDDFVRANALLIARAVESDETYSWASAGHDFALTRNGHGAGFWDRGLGEIGDELSDLAKAEGSLWLSLSIDRNAVETWTLEG